MFIQINFFLSSCTLCLSLFIIWTNLIVLCELSLNVNCSILILCAYYLLLIANIIYDHIWWVAHGSWILLNLACSFSFLCIQSKVNLFTSSDLLSLVALEYLFSHILMFISFLLTPPSKKKKPKLEFLTISLCLWNTFYLYIPYCPKMRRKVRILLASS